LIIRIPTTIELKVVSLALIVNKVVTKDEYDERYKEKGKEKAPSHTS